MENFGIFCLFILLIAVIIGIPLLLFYLRNDPNHTGIFTLLIIEITSLYYIYSVFHHGLWMLLRGR